MDSMYTFCLLAISVFLLIGATGAVSGPNTQNCEIVLYAENQGAFRLEIDLQASQLKVQSGGWGSLYESPTGKKRCAARFIRLQPGSRKSVQQCLLPLGCAYGRSYRFFVRAIYRDGKVRTAWLDFPAKEKFTKARELQLGNLARLFP